MKSYIWNEKTQTFDECPPSDPVRYADRVAARDALERQANDKRERDAHPGTYA